MLPAIFCFWWQLGSLGKKLFNQAIFGFFLMLILAFLPPNIFLDLVLFLFFGYINFNFTEFVGTGVQRWISIGV